MIEKLFQDYCDIHNRNTSDVLLEAISRYYAEPGRLRPAELTPELRRRIMAEFMDSRQTLVMNLYQPCNPRH